MNLGLPDEQELAKRRAAQAEGTAPKTTKKEKWTALAFVIFVLAVVLYNFLQK